MVCLQRLRFLPGLEDAPLLLDRQHRQGVGESRFSPVLTVDDEWSRTKSTIEGTGSRGRARKTARHRAHRFPTTTQRLAMRRGFR